MRRSSLRADCLPCPGQRPGPSPGTNSPQDCLCPGSVRGLVAQPRNSLRACGAALEQTRQVSPRSALRARPRALCSSAPHRRAPAHPSPPLPTQRWRVDEGRAPRWWLSGRRCSAGAISAAARSAGLGSARAARFVNILAASVRTQRPQGAERVTRLDPKPSTTAESARSDDRRSMSPCRAPPAATPGCSSASDVRTKATGHKATMSPQETCGVAVMTLRTECRHPCRQSRWPTWRPAWGPGRCGPEARCAGPGRRPCRRRRHRRLRGCPASSSRWR